MKMHKPLDSNSTSDNLIDLYTRIPDYSEVQHLGQSDFINTLEKLKEEFRQCRASLYNEEFCSDSEYLAEKSTPVTNRSRTVDNLCSYSSKFPNGENENKFSASTNAFRSFEGKATKINNHNLTTFNNSGVGGSTTIDTDIGNNDTGPAGHGGNREQYLSIKSCELHRTPYRSTSASSLGRPSRYLTFGRSSMEREKNDSNLQNDYDDDDDDDDEDDDEDDDDEDFGNNGQRERDRWSVGSSNSDISLSKWSSNPEIYRPKSRGKEYLPPSNTEQRLLVRKSQNNSAPSVAFKDESGDEPTKQTFRANPVPDHVYKPLYEFIMLKNQRRSERIKEQSKRRLLAQMKPSSFYKDPNKSSSYLRIGKSERTGESLNNTKLLKKRRNDMLGNIKTNNNRLHSASLFRAKPAPPRTKTLLAAIRQKEQQEYRELKKRLRSEMLLKNASLPPSMAAREKRTKITNAKIDEVLQDYQKSFQDRKRNRNYRETSTCTDDTGLLTDEDRMTEDEFGIATTKKITTIVKPFKLSHRSPRKFTSYGTSRHSAAAEGVFESSSNDNHASKLRYQAAKLKEEIRIQREEEELLRIMKAEKRRQKLRNTHLHAWQHAYSYSSEQDIAMRRQIRHAASILERESFIKDMSCMLSRVRSAPLLLEGGHRLERKQEPCKKHREEYQKQGPNNSDRPWNKLSTPRLYSSNNWIGRHNASTRSIAMLTSLDRYGGEEKSETVALAEGSLSNSDNEFGNDDDDDAGGDGGRRRNVILTDSGSDLEDDDGRQRKQKLSTNNGNASELRRVNTEEHNNDVRAPSTDKDIEDEVEEDDNQSEEEENDEDDDNTWNNPANNTH